MSEVRAPVRTSFDAPPTDAELESTTRLADASCSGNWGLLFPGLAQLCTGRRAEGAVLMSLAAAEAATAIAVGTSSPQGVDHPGAGLPLIALQDAWLYGVVDSVLDRQRALHLRYVPTERLSELALAPFNPKVLSRPDVWAGLLGMVSFGVAASVLAGEKLRTGHYGERPNIFGRQVAPAIGYPIGAAVGAALFEHVAIAEETTFRGWLQSDFSRSMGPTGGWIVGSLVFGGTHALNALLLPADERAAYLGIGVPAITVIGSYLGLTYRWHDYSLLSPVALHFWYDFLLSAVYFVADPTSSPLSASVALPF
jgi:membrane protease YdiL (CAAX protease family)